VKKKGPRKKKNRLGKGINGENREKGSGKELTTGPRATGETLKSLQKRNGQERREGGGGQGRHHSTDEQEGVDRQNKKGTNYNRTRRGCQRKKP